MGSTTEEGAALPAAVRSAMTDVGTILTLAEEFHHFFSDEKVNYLANPGYENKKGE